MTVKQLKKLISKLPPDLEVMMPVNEDLLISVCYENSEVTDMYITDDETESVLLLVPCSCHEEMEVGDINSQPELN